MITNRAFRWAVVAVACLAVVPTPSYAFFHCFCKKPPPACETCAPQTVSYMPQTCYRTQYVQVPVVTYRPVSSGCCLSNLFNHCNSCQTPTQTMRPVTTMVYQARMVPFTTYRIVPTNPCNAGLCGSMPTTTYAPIAAPAVASGGCSSCAAPAATYAPAGATYAPATTTYTTPSVAPYSAPNYAPTYSTPTYSTPGAGTVYPSPSTSTTPPIYTVPSNLGPSAAPVTPAPGAPSLSTMPGATTNRPAYPSTAPVTRNPLAPIPDANLNTSPRINPSSSPRLIDPDARTTSAPVIPAWSYSQVAWPARDQVIPAVAHIERPVIAPQPPVETHPGPVVDDGWRPSSR